ncbi:hypothetical protein H2199_008041 [Coniosporium tulheliwenetii]|uniref:Uncharacterized protein n=1 Tax=Coniosporium tulheliwenetii TaxID=3383036 RepID=A0ACC2YM86_9PEZI|nr:hypothetical protein H2199_008041 [Cladosporium sp. JES 115]
MVESETKVDRMEERLAGIERTLQNLSNSIQQITAVQGGSSLQSPTYQPINVDEALAHPSRPATSREESSFEGNTSLQAHSLHATQVAEQAISNSFAVHQSPELLSALESLKKLLDRQSMISSKEFQFPNQATIDGAPALSNKMPPLTDTSAVLKRAKDEIPQCFYGYFPFLTIERLAEMCEMVYSNEHVENVPVYIIVNVILHYLFQEYSAGEDGNASNYRQHSERCQSNLQTGLKTLSLMLPPSQENIVALLLGATYAIEMSLPSLCWTLTTTAARLCQTLGYHRASSVKDDSPESAAAKRSLFWYTYWMDKTLSLRIGRSPSIQDYEIDIDFPAPSPGSSLAAWDAMGISSIEFAAQHGQVYEQLYSPAALRQSEAERVRKALQLAKTLQEIQAKAERIQVNPVEAQAPATLDLYLKSNTVVYHALMTLIYRAVPPAYEHLSTNTNSLLHAREALRIHQECHTQCRNAGRNIWPEYIQWTILHCPFTPFMVVFCHVIATLSAEDLARLEAFVRSLQPTGRSSEGLDKAYRLFNLFYVLAKSYVQCKTGPSVDITQPGASSFDLLANQGSEEFDRYFAALGWMPGTTSYNTNGTATSQALQPQQPYVEAGDGSIPGQQLDLGGWFNSNQYFASLLEEDLSDITGMI